MRHERRVAPERRLSEAEGRDPLGEVSRHHAVDVQLVELAVVGLALLGRIVLRGGGDEDQPAQTLGMRESEFEGHEATHRHAGKDAFPDTEIVQ